MRLLWGMRACALALMLCSCQFAAVAQTAYKYPRDDIVVAMGGGLFDFIDNLSGTGYDGYYHNNGTICTTPQVTGALSQFGDHRKSHYNLLTGTVQTTVALSVFAEVRAAQCINHTVIVGAGCLSGDLPLVGPPKDDFFTILLCALNVDNFFQIALPVPVRLPYPIMLPKQYVANLPNVPSGSNLSVQLSFAKWDGSKWVPETKPADKQKIWPISGDLAFPEYLVTDTSNPGDVLFQQGRYIVGRASATHARVLNTTSDLREALSKSVGLTSYFPNNPYGIATIVIRDTLLAPQTINSPSDERFGLIGGLFPMIVSATYQPNGSTDKYGISFVIAGVTAQLGGNGGKPTINAGIIVEDLKAWDSATGQNVPARLVGKPSISIAAPSVKASGSVEMEFSALDNSIELNPGAKHTVDFGSLLKLALNQAIPKIASIEPSITIGLPQCVSMNNSRFEALSPCSDFSGAKVGFLSKGGGPAPVTLSIDFSKTQIVGSPGQIEIDLERVCVPRPHTQC
ncbi:hypothetical protein [Bradyrhizobium vignae]|uniref:hypothetical protein n=1 Tax=Bradyrhizobium vignae TaxID=1549949 RepID=UPI00100B6A53|nr:hypothetical protein [Bradyrhizobium vignae]RXG97198.1 hypothetical protein EAV90_22795 [Bradyrhizobium vignae]